MLKLIPYCLKACFTKRHAQKAIRLLDRDPINKLIHNINNELNSDSPICMQNICRTESYKPNHTSPLSDYEKTLLLVEYMYTEVYDVISLANKVDISGKLVLSSHHSFTQAYNYLNPFVLNKSNPSDENDPCNKLVVRIINELKDDSPINIQNICTTKSYKDGDTYILSDYEKNTLLYPYAGTKVYDIILLANEIDISGKLIFDSNVTCNKIHNYLHLLKPHKE